VSDIGYATAQLGAPTLTAGVLGLLTYFAVKGTGRAVGEFLEKDEKVRS